METIYTGNEPMLAEMLIERAIKEHKIDVFDIKTIRVECYTPKDEAHLWTIAIIINAKFSYRSYFYSKNCIHHGYSITYLQHLKNMGVKKIKIKKLKAKE